MSNGEKSATAKTLSLILTIKSLRNKIYVGKDIVRVLGAPRYVCVKINEDMSSLAIQPGDEKEYMSFKVPEKLFLSHKCEFTINSMNISSLSDTPDRKKSDTLTAKILHPFRIDGAWRPHGLRTAATPLDHSEIAFSRLMDSPLMVST